MWHSKISSGLCKHVMAFEGPWNPGAAIKSDCPFNTRFNTRPHCWKILNPLPKDFFMSSGSLEFSLECSFDCVLKPFPTVGWKKMKLHSSKISDFRWLSTLTNFEISASHYSKAPQWYVSVNFFKLELHVKPGRIMIIRYSGFYTKYPYEKRQVSDKVVFAVLCKHEMGFILTSFYGLAGELWDNVLSDAAKVFSF